MENELSYSGYDSGKILIETFGRGKLPQTQQTLSQRNNFERQKLLREKYGHKKSMGGSRNTVTFRQKPNLYEKDYQYKKLGYQSKSQHKQPQFEQLDEISQKINGIIRSISISCHKHSINEKAKTPQLQKSSTVDRLHHLQQKYNASASSIKHSSHLKNEDICEGSGHQQAKKLHHSIKSQNCLKKETKNYHQTGYEHEQREDEDFDNINERIQYINDKIAKYEKKMTGYQQTYQTNKGKNEEYLSTSKGLKETTFDNKNKEHIDSEKIKKNIIPTNKGKVIKNKDNRKEKENVPSEKENKLLDNNVKRQGTYSGKQKVTVQSGKKSTKGKQPRLQTQKTKTSIRNSRKQYSQSRQNHENGSIQIDKTSMPTKCEDKISQKTTFFKSLMRQIALDQDFRHAKHMYGGMDELFAQSSHTANKKWAKLQAQLKNEGISLSVQEVKHIFMPRDDEIDPFMSVSHSHEQLVHGLIFAYQAAQRHWKDNFYRNWTFWELKQSNFISQRVDRGKKGYITLQDLTLYINTQVDGFYRNRDLLLIFNRLGLKQHLGEHKTSLKFKQIMDIFLSA